MPSIASWVPNSTCWLRATAFWRKPSRTLASSRTTAANSSWTEFVSHRPCGAHWHASHDGTNRHASKNDQENPRCLRPPGGRSMADLFDIIRSVYADTPIKPGICGGTQPGRGAFVLQRIRANNSVYDIRDLRKSTHHCAFPGS